MRDWDFKRTRMLALIVVFVTMASHAAEVGEATTPTEPTLDEQEQKLIGTDRPLIAYLLEAKSVRDRWSAMGNVARGATIVFLLIGALRVKIVRRYVWDPIPQRWRIVILLVVATGYGTLTNISQGNILWYNALLDSLVVGANALLMKKLLWNALLGKGKTLKIENALKLLKLQ